MKNKLSQKIIAALITNIDNLCKNKNVSVAEMLRECGLNKSTVNSMKNGSLPSADKLMTISNYFGTTLDYLLGNEDGDQKLYSPEVMYLAETISEASDEDKQKVLKYFISLKSQSDKK